jgi:hypothetical protein
MNAIKEMKMLIQEFEAGFLIKIGNQCFPHPDRESVYIWLSENGYKTWQFEYEYCFKKLVG